MGTSKAGQKNANLLKFFDNASKGLATMAQGMADVLRDVEGQGRKRAPLRFGFLRANVNAEPIKVVMTGGRALLRGSVSARTPYAYIQHENVFNHPKGGEDHYLTRPIEERSAMYTKALGAEVMSSLKKAVV